MLVTGGSDGDGGGGGVVMVLCWRGPSGVVVVAGGRVVQAGTD